MKALMISCGMIVTLVLLTSGSMPRTEAEPPPSSPETATEPMKPPFEPYDPGTNATWSYSELTSDEKALADRGRNVDYTAIHDGYKTAVRQRSEQARAAAAAGVLGLDTLETGVVP